jgi:sRNA-binding regulator protein Hfq
MQAWGNAPNQFSTWSFMSNESIPSNVTHLSRVERAAPAEGRFGGGRYGNAEARPAAPFQSRDGEKKKFVAKGHDSQLQDAQFGKNKVRLSLLGGGTVRGTISRRDKFTITLRHEQGDTEVSGLDEIFYKHAIEGVLVFPRAAADQE